MEILWNDNDLIVSQNVLCFLDIRIDPLGAAKKIYENEGESESGRERCIEGERQIEGEKERE